MKNSYYCVFNSKGAFLLRLAMAFVMLFAGINKFTNGIPAFVDMMSQGFAETFLPLFLVKIFFYIIPIAEIILGLWLLSGQYKKEALFATGILFILFIFGFMVKGDMGSIPNHLIYLLTIAYAMDCNYDNEEHYKESF